VVKLSKPIQVATRVDPDLLDRVESWRSQVRPLIPSMSQALRTLIERGLDTEPTEQTN
jgi:hypothetical protein